MGEEIDVQRKIPQNNNDFFQTLDSIANQLSSMSSLGTAVNDEDDDDAVSCVTTQMGKRKGIQKQQSKKQKSKQKKNLEKAVSYQDRLDTTVVNNLHEKIRKLPEEKQRRQKNRNVKK